MESQPLHLSFSKAECYSRCPRQYYYRYVMKLEPVIESANLAFGSAIDGATGEFLRGVAQGASIDPEPIFSRLWQGHTRLDFTNKKLNHADLMSIGRNLTSRFPMTWEQSGLHVATLPDGEPGVQVTLSVTLGDDIVYNSKIDLLAFDTDGRLGISDIKTAGSTTPAEFELVSTQLTDYQMQVEANWERLGIQPGDVEWLNFIELRKTKGAPVAVLPMSPRRSDEVIQERIEEIRTIAENIRAERFPRHSGIAFASPCALCEFRAACTRQDYSGLQRRNSTPTLAGLSNLEFDFEEAA